MNNHLLEVIATEEVARLNSHIEQSTPERIKRWTNAVEKAFDYLRNNGTNYGVAYKMLPTGLAVVSSDKNTIHFATRNECDCDAYVNSGNPCWHRAAYTLISKYNMVEKVLQGR